MRRHAEDDLAECKPHALGKCAPPSAHVNALLSTAKADGISGRVRADLVMAYYLEVCFDVGLEPYPADKFFKALGNRVTRRKLTVDGREDSYYFLSKYRKKGAPHDRLY